MTNNNPILRYLSCFLGPGKGQAQMSAEPAATPTPAAKPVITTTARHGTWATFLDVTPAERTFLLFLAGVAVVQEAAPPIRSAALLFGASWGALTFYMRYRRQSELTDSVAAEKRRSGGSM